TPGFTQSSDVTPPTFVSMSESPASVNAGDTVMVDVRITDAESGVVPDGTYPYVFYKNAGGSFAGSTLGMTRISGTPQDGVYRGTVNVPSSAASGRWKIDSMSAKDAAGNQIFVFPPTVPTADGEFDVVGSTADVTPPTF